MPNILTNICAAKNGLRVTATDTHLIAWEWDPDVDDWIEVARKPGGASYYASALAMQFDAQVWLTELLLTDVV